MTTMSATHASTTAAPSTRTQAMADGRRTDTARRRQRVIAALDRAVAQGTEIGVSAIVRAAAVDRSFLYRHRDLLEKLHALAAAPPAGPDTAPAVPRCRPTCSPPTNAPPGSTLASSTSRSVSPKRSASTPGASPAWAPQPTSTP